MTTNPIFLQGLPPPFPSPIPSSPLTPPMNFKTAEGLIFETTDFSHLQFNPLNAPIPVFASDNPAVFCTVSAPSTPASDRKCIDKFCISETSNDGRTVADKKKAKRVSIAKDEPSQSADSQEINNNEAKDGEKKALEGSNGTHHSHQHKSHAHMHPKRRMSLDNTMVRF